MSQSLLNQSRTEIQLITDGGDPRQEHAFGTALRSQIHPTASGQGLPHPLLCSLLILW
jgi:hypothetical protein